MCQLGDFTKLEQHGVEGWRTWKIRGALTKVRITALTRDFTWARFTKADRAPRASTTFDGHGLWAYTKRDEAERRATQPLDLLGRVRLTGTVACHARGARGEFAEITGIVLPTTAPTPNALRYRRGRAKRIAKLLGVPVIP